VASIHTDPKTSCRRIQFFDTNGNRKSLGLGVVSMRAAELVRSKVEHIVQAQILGHALDDDVAKWISSRDDRMITKLAKAGLTSARKSATLDDFLTGYIADQSKKVKAATVTVYGHTKRNLVDFFGKAKALRDITPGDAGRWETYLTESARDSETGNKGLASNTVRRRCGIAKQFFQAAIDDRLISSNPFAKLAAGTRRVDERFYFVTREEALKVLDACADSEWKLIFALSRYGGLRCPSEHLALRWIDVDLIAGRMLVTSPKTAHHEGKEHRTVPIFPELRPYLVDAQEAAPDGAEFVISRYRDSNTNLRTQLERVIKRAGLTPWPKLFQNLRSTRETELAESFPIHVVCEWIGNSEAVAKRHYLQVTEDHFAKAVAMPDGDDAKTVQKTVQHVAASERTNAQQETDDSEIFESLEDCRESELLEVGPPGLEPGTKGL